MRSQGREPDNTGRPHMALGPGVPDPPLSNLEHPHPNSRHRRGESYAVRVNPLKFEQRRGRLNSPTSIAAVLGVLSIGVAIVIHVVWPVDKVARIGAWVTVGLVLAGFVVIRRGRAESRFNGGAPSV